MGSAIAFLHLTPDCSGNQRYLPNVNGPGYAFVGQVFGSHVIYSRVVDPGGNGSAFVPAAEEIVLPFSDINAPGLCMPLPEYLPLQPMGAAEIVLDPAIGLLRAPFRVR